MSEQTQRSDYVIPTPTADDFRRDLAADYAAYPHETWKCAGPMAAIRLAIYYRRLADCGEACRAENDELASENGELTEELERFRQENSEMALRLAQLRILIDEMAVSAAKLNRDNAQIHEAQLRLTHALARIIERSEDADVREIAARALGRVSA